MHRPGVGAAHAGGGLEIPAAHQETEQRRIEAGADVRQPQQQVGQAVGLHLLAAGVEADRRGCVGMSGEVRRLVAAIVEQRPDQLEFPQRLVPPTDPEQRSRSATIGGGSRRSELVPRRARSPHPPPRGSAGTRPARSTPTPPWRGSRRSRAGRSRLRSPAPGHATGRANGRSSRRPSTLPARCRAPRMRGPGARSASRSPPPLRRRRTASRGRPWSCGGRGTRTPRPPGARASGPAPRSLRAGGGRTRAPSSRGSRPRSAGSRASIPASAAGPRPPSMRGRPRVAGHRAAPRRGSVRPPGSSARLRSPSAVAKNASANASRASVRSRSVAESRSASSADRSALRRTSRRLAAIEARISQRHAAWRSASSGVLPLSLASATAVA